MSNTKIDRPDKVTLAFCEICDNYTPEIEVYHTDVGLDESWSESDCKYCFESFLEYEDLYSQKIASIVYQQNVCFPNRKGGCVTCQGLSKKKVEIMKMYPYTCVVCNAGFLSLYVIVANPSCDPCSHLADMKTMARFGTD